MFRLLCTLSFITSDVIIITAALIAVAVLLMIFIVALVVVVMILVRRKKHGDLDMRIYDTVQDTVSGSHSQRPTNYEIPVSAPPRWSRASTKNAQIYRTAMSTEAKDQQHSASNGSSEVDKDSTIGEEEEYVEMYEDMSGADAQYQTIQQDQVQVHHYASLGATAQGEAC